MLSRWLAFVVWALVAGTAAAWALRLLVPSAPVPAAAVVANARAAAGGDLTRLFGARPPEPVAVAATTAPPPPERNRFQLLGVVAAGPAAARVQGVALIAVDGKTPRAYRVGHRIDGDLALLEVRQRGVDLGPAKGPASITLDLPALPPPATGMPGGAALQPSPIVPGTAAVVVPPPAQAVVEPQSPQLAAQPGFGAMPSPAAGLPPALRMRGQRQMNLQGFPLPSQPPSALPAEQQLPADVPQNDPRALR